MLHIRDDAFAQLGDTNLKDLKVAGSSPPVTVDSVTDLTPAEDPLIARKVEGTMTVPCYLTNGCAPGGSFSFDKRGLPRRMGTTTAKFFCNIPRSALDPASPPKARPSLYGHGLLGKADEVNAGNVQGDVERAQLRVLRDRRGPASRATTCRTSSRCWATSPASTRSPTACSRAS